MHLGDPLDQRQAQPRAAAAGPAAIEAVEGARPLVGGHAGAVVAHGDRHLATAGMRLDAQLRRGVAQRVLAQVAQGDRQRFRIDARRQCRRVGLDADALGARRCLQRIDRLGDDPLERHCRQRAALDRARVQARQRQHGLDHPGGAVDPADQRPQRLAALAVVARAQGHLRLGPQCRQRRAQFVRRVRGQRALVPQGLVDPAEQPVHRQPDRLQLGGKPVEARRRRVARGAGVDRAGKADHRRRHPADDQPHAERQYRGQHQAGQQQPQRSASPELRAHGDRLGDVDRRALPPRLERVHTVFTAGQPRVGKAGGTRRRQRFVRRAGRVKDDLAALRAHLVEDAFGVRMIDGLELDLGLVFVLGMVLQLARDHRQHRVCGLDQRRVEQLVGLRQCAAVQPQAARPPGGDGGADQQPGQPAAQRPGAPRHRRPPASRQPRPRCVSMTSAPSLRRR